MHYYEIYIIECRDLLDEGISCVTRTLQAAATVRRVSTEDEFIDAATEILALAAQPPQAHRKLLIISCHGKPRTGTWFTCNGNDIRFTTMHRTFANRPENLVVYISACWGTYTASVAMLQSGTAPKPIVCGATVKIKASDADRLQGSIIALMEQEQDLDRAIEVAVKTANEDLGHQYFVEHVFRYASTDGTMRPEQGAMTLSVEPIKKEYVVTAVTSRAQWREPAVPVAFSVAASGAGARSVAA